MQPYVIRQGDYLAKLAHKFGFDADAVWGHDKNAGLRQDRPDPNILWPTDILHIPDQVDKQPVTHSLVIGTTNTFVSNAPTVPVTVRFCEPFPPSQPCTIAELPHLMDLTTDGNGVLTFQAPVSLETATITFASATPAVMFTCRIGHLDPMDTLSGIFQRLQNLGYIGDDAEFDEDDLDLLRGGLNALRISIHGPPSVATLSPAMSSDSGPYPTLPTNYTPSNDETPAIDSDSSIGGPSGPPKVAPRGLFGLSDDGVLDDETTQMLRTAYGC